mmetsp:Transcript_3848/g.8094  ORF Transcript_3848/g.8094 Transcript_3848/m.8094 type:complete len:91 (+) Transcript_3848:2-274(+)
MDTWYNPTSWPCADGECPEGKYSVGDVFFAEICVLNQICTNGDELFHLDKGQPFNCHLSRSAYDSFAQNLQQSLQLHPPPPPIVTHADTR